MALAPGSSLGSYQIVAKIGEGGMGEVYRGHDARLNRDVALKVLPDLLAADSDRLARFRREAQVLASLNHSNIAHLYGFEESTSVHALVMELVEGSTLADRIAHGPIPIAEALPIARQIIDALEAAHEQGVVHRDLKPANIKVKDDGTVKVLDFGLAKAMDPAAASSAEVLQSPTMTARATQIGVILGTAAYMAPEQAKGKVVDKRADIWSFGVVVYEMLTGTCPFIAETIPETLAHVMMRDVDLKTLPPETPPQVRKLLAQCLLKDPKQRLRDIGDARLILDERAEPGAVPAPPVGRKPRAAALLWGALATVALVAAVDAAWHLTPARGPSPVVTRFTHVLADGQSFGGLPIHTVTISPDGARLAYIANGQLYVRAMDQLEAVPIRGTNEDPFEPVFSPDGTSIIYFIGTRNAPASGFTMRKIAIAGGAPVTLAQLAGGPIGAICVGDRVIVAVSGRDLAAVQSVPAAGGTPETLVPLDPKKQRPGFPQITADGRTLVFVLMPLPSSSDDDNEIVMQPIRGGDRKVLVKGGTGPRLLPTGHLLYSHGSTVLAASFDPAKGEVGSPVPVLEGVLQAAPLWTSEYAVSSNGTLVFVPGTSGSAPKRSLLWVDRQGHEQPIGATPRAYWYPRLSPDGGRIAVGSNDEENDIWIFDLAKETLMRLTFGPASEIYSPWTPDGKQLLFSSGNSPTSSARDIFRKSADGTGPTEALSKNKSTGNPSSISPDGKLLVYRTGLSSENMDLMILPLDGSGEARPLLADPKYGERNGEVSPDGKWIAYDSNESGRYEVYVRPFPAVDTGRWQISSEGGVFPMWARSGKELFFVAVGTRQQMMALPVQTAAGFTYGKPQPLFDIASYFTSTGRMFDVAPDGKRFLMVKNLNADVGARPSIVVVSNWLDELKAKLPAARR